MDRKNLCINIFSAERKNAVALCVLPLLFVFLVIAVAFLPTSVSGDGSVNLRTLEVSGFPISIVIEHSGGVVRSAWLRTPAGARELQAAVGLSLADEHRSFVKADHDNEKDLLWRLSFMNFEGEGVNYWIGMTSFARKVFVTSAPFELTRWNSVPAMIEVPKGTSLCIASATPHYSLLANKFSGKDSYSFIYTVRMTQDGPRFVPVPSVYKQLAMLLRAGMQGEVSHKKRAAYVKMLTEFNRLADGKAPQAETLLNFPMEDVDSFTLKR
ncbi:MAG: hypothetical protein Q4E17_06005 [Synergistes sp.]|nr:hypothetical protein [Synergistes sp.]